MTSPTQRSLKFLRDQGYLAQVVERWNQYAKVRQDLFGFIDIVVIRANIVGVVAVQTTSAANQAARIRKLSALPAAAVWLAAQNKIEVHGWKKVKGRWAVTVTEIKPAQAEAATA